MKNNITWCLLLCLSLLLGACKSTNNNVEVSLNTSLLVDKKFPNYEQAVIESEENIFALDQDMLAMVATKLKPERNIEKRAAKLLHHIFSTENINLSYDSRATKTAMQTYHSSKANCMSLTIMAYSLAKEANLNINFQEVDVPEYWVRNGRYSMLMGHVNLMVTDKSLRKAPGLLKSNDMLQIDFDPYAIKKSFSRRIIQKNTVLAMFYNNKGAEALVELDYNKAYAYLKSAVIQDPAFSVAWGNLGILYRLTNNIDLAINVYRYAISLDEENLTSMTNLSMLLRLKGETSEVLVIEKILHQKRIKNPYYHALLADEAFYRGDNKLAITHFKKAIKLNKRIHEFYYALAKVYYRLDELVLARNVMKKAISINKQESVENIYVAKLNFLQQAQY